VTPFSPNADREPGWIRGWNELEYPKTGGFRFGPAMKWTPCFAFCRDEGGSPNWLCAGLRLGGGNLAVG